MPFNYRLVNNRKVLTYELLSGKVLLGLSNKWMAMQRLRKHLNKLSIDDQAAFARAVGSSIGYLRKAISVGQELNPATCVAIERVSGRAVTRQDLRPNDWEDIWPELAEKNEDAA